MSSIFGLKCLFSGDKAEQPDVRSGFGSHLVPMMLLLGAAFALYGKAIGHDFLSNWDDNTYVTDNPDIMGFTHLHLIHAFTKYYNGNYAPLHIMSYMLDYTLGGLNAGIFKLTNVTLHAFNTLLYYALLVRLTGKRFIALAAAAIFLCHPVQVESVVWISQRKNLLAMFFFLISFLSYITWKERKCFKIYVFSLGAFLLALLSKSVVVIFPLVLICYDICFQERKRLWLLVREKLPYTLMAAACAVVALFSQKGIGGGMTSYLGGSALITMLNMLSIFSNYMILLLFPARLSMIYITPVRTSLDSGIVLSALLVVVFVFASIYFYRCNRRIFFWGFLFFIGFLPVSNIIPMITLMNDRYLYFPMLGFAALIAHVPIFERGQLPLRQFMLSRALFIALLLGLSAVTWQRIDVWRNSVALWGDAVMKAEDGYRYGQEKNFIVEGYAEALTKLGDEAKRKGNISEARYYYLHALAYDDTSLNALNNLGCFATMEGKPLAGRQYLIRFTEIYPDDERGYANLGLNYQMSGELDQAEENFRKALKINPRNETVRESLKEIAEQRGVHVRVR